VWRVRLTACIHDRPRVAGIKAVLCIGGITAGGRLVVRPLYRRISALNNSDVFAATTLLVVLGTSVLTQAAGLSLALGAFLVRASLPCC
jgi:Kef-type K+ transport system membrane component KefB